MTGTGKMRTFERDGKANGQMGATVLLLVGFLALSSCSDGMLNGTGEVGDAYATRSFSSVLDPLGEVTGETLLTIKYEPEIEPDSFPPKEVSVTSGNENITNFAVFGGYGSTIYRYYPKYDLSSVPEDAEIISAIYSVYVSAALGFSDQDGHVFVYQILEPWDSAIIDWDNQPAVDFESPYAERIFTDSSTWKGAGYYDWDIAELVQFWLDNPGTDYGFVLAEDPNNAGNMKIAGYKSNYADPARRPALEIIYTLPPNPGG